jgi:hypothetical protein
MMADKLDLTLLCEEGPCADIVSEYHQETANLRVILTDSLKTSPKKPYPVANAEVVVVSKEDGHQVNVTSEHLDPKTGEAVFLYQATTAGYYEITVTFDGQGEDLLLWAQDRRVVQVIPGRRSQGSETDDYLVRFDLRDFKINKLIQFLNADKKPLDIKTGTRIGLFDQAVEKDPDEKHLTDFRHDPMLNDIKEEDNFIGADSRRFYIQVNDKNPTRVKALGGNKFVEVDWMTLSQSGNVMDDNGGQLGTRITLQEVPGKPGTFLSRALMIVSQERDLHIGPTHSGYEKVYPAESVLRPKGSSDFRLRLGELFGKVKACYPVGDIQENSERIQALAPVFSSKDVRYVPLHFFILTDEVVDAIVVHHLQQTLAAVLKKVRDVLAPVGIFPYTVAHSVPDAMLRAKRSQVHRISVASDPRDFAYAIANTTVRRANGEPVAIDKLTHDDQERLATLYRFERHTLRVFLTKGIVSTTGEPNFGLSFSDNIWGETKLRSSLFSIPDLAPNSQIIAHELVHLLTDKPPEFGQVGDPMVPTFNNHGCHYQRPEFPTNNRFRHFYNLMGGFERKEEKFRFRLWDVDVIEESQKETYHGHKNKNFFVDNTRPPVDPFKIFNQYNDIRKSPYTQSLDAYLKDTKSTNV